MGVNRNGRGLVWAIVLACLAAVQALAAQEVTKPISRKQQATLSSAVFLNAHPDMKHRKQGWDAYAEGDFALARAQFLKAAWYGDKPSQAMLAEMDWKGEGAAVDRASAYTWADIAAERGYAVFVGVRERYWRALDSAEKARVAQDGPARLAEYGDGVARGRLEQHLRRHLRDIQWSSRTVAPPRTVTVYDHHGVPTRIDGSRFFSPTFWDPAQYQAWQDAQWRAPPEGSVEVGEVEQVRPPEGE